MMSAKCEQHKLFCPPLEDVAKALRSGLSQNFAESSVEVVVCPDLSEEPWGIASSGLCGSPRVGEVGGIPYLFPLPKKEKVYNLHELAQCVELPNALVIGAGAGPFPHLKVNSEFIANTLIGSPLNNLSRTSKIDSSTGKSILESLPSSETGFAFLLNFFACEGKKGPVLKIKAKCRTGKQDFVGCLRKSLEEAYDEKSIGIGGTFRLCKGSVKIHVMPDFSTKPLTCDADVEEWLRFFDVEAPVVFMSVVVSKDLDFDVRLEHSHGYGISQGGHYHYDVTPETVEYEGYFNVAEFLYRIDRPAKVETVFI